MIPDAFDMFHVQTLRNICPFFSDPENIPGNKNS